MDRKSIIILVVSFIVLMLWYPLVVNKLYPPKPLPKGMTNAPALATNQPPVAATNQPLEVEPSTPRLLPSTTAPEQTIEVTNAYAHYIFTSRGGGLSEVQLVHPELKNPPGEIPTLNTHSPAPALAIVGSDTFQGDGNFNIARTPNGVRAEKTLPSGLRITKDFDPTTNYLVATTVRLQNTGTNPLVLPPQDWIVGTATPLSANDRTVGVLWYNGAKTETVGASFFSSRGFACMPRVPPSEYRGGNSNVVWAAAHNQFFALVLMPQQPASALVVQRVNLPPLGTTGTATNGPPPEGYLAAMVYPELRLAPGQTFERQFFVYAGPKEYKTLARIADTFKNELDKVMGWGFFAFVSKALLLSMNWLHHVLKLSYAWAIIVITIVIKLVFWPLTQASTRSMKRMQALQPQMKAIQEKYKDDPAKMNRKTMEFMKEHKVNPMGGCLPMVIQIPVFFGFYWMIQSAIELRGESFLWIKDLSKPDTLFTIPGTNFPFNLLPLIMGATMLWQARLTPPSPGMDPTQAKIMKYMPLIFMVFLYNFSAGLTLYWTVQNLLTIAQTKLTKTTNPEPPGKGPVLTPPQKKKK